MVIGKHSISSEQPPYIIAEMSGNHNKSIERARQIIAEAARAGAHAIKLQTYTPDSITIDHRGGAFEITDPNSLWVGRNLYELYAEACTPYEWHGELFDYAREVGIDCFSSPFDEAAVDLLENLNAPAYKIASFENAHWPLLAYVARTGKPILMSSGVSSLEELAGSVAFLRQNGVRDLALLKCTSTYPSSPANTNLRTIPHMQQLFQCKVGLSDHTMGTGVSVAAVAMGACVVEKHFCLSRAEGGVDSAFSLEPAELAALVSETRRAWEAMGQVQYGIESSEEKSRIYKRSLYFVQAVQAGETLKAEHLRVIRPGGGLAPRHLDQVLGMRLSRDVARGEAVTWESFQRGW